MPQECCRQRLVSPVIGQSGRRLDHLAILLLGSVMQEQGDEMWIEQHYNSSEVGSVDQWSTVVMSAFILSHSTRCFPGSTSRCVYHLGAGRRFCVARTLHVQCERVLCILPCSKLFAGRCLTTLCMCVLYVCLPSYALPVLVPSLFSLGWCA